MFCPLCGCEAPGCVVLFPKRGSGIEERDGAPAGSTLDESGVFVPAVAGSAPIEPSVGKDRKGHRGIVAAIVAVVAAVSVDGLLYATEVIGGAAEAEDGDTILSAGDRRRSTRRGGPNNRIGAAGRGSERSVVPLLVTRY
jgi:hypothetical protein